MSSSIFSLCIREIAVCANGVIISQKSPKGKITLRVNFKWSLLSSSALLKHCLDKSAWYTVSPKNSIQSNDDKI